MPHEKLELIKIDLDRVKSDAKRIHKTQDISLCEAQNKIACSFGYHTFETLRTAVLAARAAQPIPRSASDDPDLEKLLSWFRSRFTHIDHYESRLSPLIAKSLKLHVQKHGKSSLRPVNVADEIDFGYDPNPFRMKRHPKALAAEEFLEAEGEWVANTFLDSLRIQKSGLRSLWGDDHDTVVGDRFTIPVVDEEEAGLVLA